MDSDSEGERKNKIKIWEVRNIIKFKIYTEWYYDGGDRWEIIWYEYLIYVNIREIEIRRSIDWKKSRNGGNQNMWMKKI